MHDGRVSHAVHFRILSRRHKFSLSAHKSVNCSPYKPTVKPRPQSGKILVGAAIIISATFPVEAIIISQLDVTQENKAMAISIQEAAEMAKARTNNKRWRAAIDKAIAGVASGNWIVTRLNSGVMVTTESGQTYL
jgi:hypothetical protein